MPQICLTLPGAEFFEEIGPEDLGLLCDQGREQSQSCLVDKGDEQSRRSLRRRTAQIGGNGFGPRRRPFESGFTGVAPDRFGPPAPEELDGPFVQTRFSKALGTGGPLAMARHMLGAIGGQQRDLQKESGMPNGVRHRLL